MNTYSSSIDFYLLITSILLLSSVLISKITGFMGIPSLLLFLAVGMIAGSEGPGGIYFDNYLLSQSIGIIALVAILFEGGLQTEWKQVRPVAVKGVILSTLGVLLTAVSIGVFAQYYLGFSLLEGMLLGSIISSTDAAAVFSILRSNNISLKGNLKALLEFESGSNDPMAVFLTLGFINILNSPATSLVDLILLFFQQLTLGTAIGYLSGKCMILIANRIRLGYEGLYPVFSLACMALIYSGAAAIGGSGFLAVYIAGIILGSSNFLHKNSVVKFHQGLAWLAQITMFLTLGLLVFPSHLTPVFTGGLALTAFLIFIARPISIWLTMPFKDVSYQEKTLISWVGLRGATPIVLSIFPLIAQLPKAHYIFNLIFFVVLFSVALQGTTIPWVARKLKLINPFPEKKRSPIEFSPEDQMDTELVNITVPENSKSIGRKIVKLGIPSTALIVLLNRNNQFIIPRGETTFEANDDLLVLANEDDLQIIKTIIETDESSASLAQNRSDTAIVS